ncbi:TonB-dependent receptor domain-containing protein [Chitinimonas sp. JJ19]|uniref:TonB-dependent receptor domain-containing protein n=1 Tax=Chitinimonas sp. JJ19 TaxID=3109352 RepID=UPI002FFEA6B2
MKMKYLALAIATLGYTGHVHAADTATPIEKIEVTGSNIKRLSKETASPVQVVSREDIQRTGANTFREFIDTLSSSTSALSDIGGSSSFASGSSGASLRNLGKASTLVLLNSRRVSNYALGDGAQENFVNLDALPTEAIERVEILKDGASAIYGSDAVAGVINIITRRNYTGLKLKASHQQSVDQGKLEQQNASITAGFGNANEDRYNVLVNADFYQRNDYTFRDLFGESNKTALALNPSIGTFSTFAFPGNLIGGGQTGPLTGCAPSMIQGGLCRFDQWARIGAVPKSKRANFFSSGEFRFSDDLKAFGDISYSNIKTEYKGTPPAYGAALGTTEWAAADGSIQIFTPRGLPAQHPLNQSGSEIEFRYRFADAEPLLGTKVDSDQYRFMGGLKGIAGNWDWETAAGYTYAKTVMTQRSQYSRKGFKEVIGDYDIDDPLFFNKAYKIGQQNSYEVLNKLFPQYVTQGETSQSFIDGKFSNSALAELPAGPLGIAAGFDLRREDYESKDSDILAKEADLVGRGSSAASGSRTYGAAFVELNVPVLDKLEAQLAARVDKFENFDAHVSPKLGLRFQASPSLILRGTFAGGFRAPNLLESSDSELRAFAPGLSDPQRCDAATNVYNSLNADADASTDPTEAAILRAKAESVYGDSCSFSLASRTKSNKNLKPETSDSKTLGFVFEPVKGFSVSVDYWHIARKNEINSRSAQEVLNNESNFPGQVTRAAALTALDIEMNQRYAGRADHQISAHKLTGITRTYENISKTKTSGYDIDLQTSFRPSGLGKLDVDLSATYTKDLYSWSDELKAYGDNLAGRYGYSRLKSVLSADWSYGVYSVGVRTNFSSGYALQDDYTDTTYSPAGCARLRYTAAQCRVGSHTTVDLALGYTGIKNLNLMLNVKNLMNRDEPLDLRQYRSDATETHSNARQLRMVKVSADYKFY